MLTLLRKIARHRKGLVLEGRHLWGARFSRAPGVDPAPPKTRPPTVVSLTSIPERLHTVPLCVESLLRQSEKPNRIILWLGEDVTPDEVPPLLVRQERRGLEIRHRPDLGPHTKIQYALREMPDALVVTCDDDILYPPDWLADLHRAYEASPEIVHCHRAHLMTFDEEGEVRPYGEWVQTAPGERGPSMRLFPTGVGGVLYPPGSLHPEVTNATVFREICPMADDVWLKAMEILAGTPSRKVRPDFGLHHMILRSQTRTLAAENVQQDANTRQLRAVFEHYGIRGRDLTGES